MELCSINTWESWLGNLRVPVAQSQTNPNDIKQGLVVAGMRSVLLLKLAAMHDFPVSCCLSACASTGDQAA